MFKTFAIAAALTLLAGAADAQKLDAKGKCHGPDGKFAAMSVCQAATPKKAPQCKKGKLCGDTCISAKDVCHKK